jgi:hypothetical protein
MSKNPFQFQKGLGLHELLEKIQQRRTVPISTVQIALVLRVYLPCVRQHYRQRTQTASYIPVP